MKTKHYNFSGFTLVELIVVITILVILGTIGFTSMSSFSSNARDSSRSSDLAIIAKSLDIGLIKTGSYPDPEDASSVTYSGGTLWKQGIIGDTTLNIINAGGGIKLSSKPTDPLTTTKPYSYSKTSFGNFYQLKSDWEGDSIAYYDREGIMKDESLVIASERSERGNPGYSSVFSHCTNEGIQGLFNLDCFVPGVPLGYRNDRSFIFPQVNASPGNPTLTYIRGNYNGMVAKTEVGNIKYLIAIPSLFLSSSTQTGTIVLTTNTQTGFSLHNQTNSGGISFAPQLVFSSGSLPTTPTEKILFASGIANAYSGNILFANSSNIKPFITTLTSTPVNTGALESLGGNLVVGSLGGSASATTNGGGQQTPTALVCGSATSCYNISAYTTPVLNSTITTDGGKHLVLHKSTSNFYYWQDTDGSNKILAANGLDTGGPNGDGWAGINNYNATPRLTYMTNGSTLEGRVQPPHVYVGKLDDATAQGTNNPTDRFNTEQWLYYDAFNAQQTLNANTTTSRVTGFTTWGTAKWFYGNVAVCQSKGMRLPVLYEVNKAKSTWEDWNPGTYQYMPTGDGAWPGRACATDECTTGVKGHTSNWAWTASSFTNNTDVYWIWYASTTEANRGDYSLNYYVRCVSF